MIKIHPLLALIFISNIAFGFGGVVTDPGSYSYYATQIEQAIEQVRLAEEQVNQATKTYNKVTSLEKNITGNAQRAGRNLEKIKDLQNISKIDIEKSLRYAKKALKDVEEIPEYKKGIMDGVDSIFSKDNKDGGWVNVEAEKRAARQQSFKKSLVDSELTLGKIEIQYERMEELAQATNETDSLKDSTDVTNTILLEMLGNQRDLITLLANVSQNVSLAFYDGDSQKTKSQKTPSLTQDSKVNNKKAYAGCSPFDKSCNRKSMAEIMAEIKASTEE
jgi:hypothetical protein